MVNRRRRTRVRARTTSRPSRRVIKRMVMGHSIKPSFDPPSYSACPYWPFTVAATIDKDSSFTGVDLHKLVKQTISDPNGKLSFAMRLMVVRCWGLKQASPIQLSVCDTTHHWSEEINDFGDQTRYSRVGWKFGDIVSQAVIKKENNDILFTVATPGSNKVLVVINLLIHPDSIVDPSLVRSQWLNGSERSPPDDNASMKSRDESISLVSARELALRNELQSLMLQRR